MCQHHYDKQRRQGDPLYIRPERTCNVVGCTSKHEAKGFCNKHYLAYRAGVRPLEYTHTCDFCGTEFQSNRRTQNCCGADRCKQDRASRYSREYTKAHGESRRYYYDLTCTFCGTAYVGTHEAGKHCPDCRGIALVASRFPDNLPIYVAIQSGTPQDVLDAIRGRSMVTPSDCWEWQGSRTSGGYGLISTGRIDGRSQEFAHRVAYEQATGVEPKGMTVHHICANPPCCNPDHLQLATHRENIAEMHARLTYEAQIKALSAELAKHDPDNPLLR